MKSSRTWRLILTIACILLVIFFGWLALRGVFSSSESSLDTPEPQKVSSKSDSTSFSIPLEDEDTNTTTSQDTTGANVASSTPKNKSSVSVVVTKTNHDQNETPQGDSNEQPPADPINTAPQLSVTLPTEGIHTASETDNTTHYKALVFSALATDAEDGDITDPLQYHWSNTTANCAVVGDEACENEKDGNNFTMNLPVSGICSGTKAEDLSTSYLFNVTVKDSNDLTDSEEITVSITYHCVADPASFPLVYLINPRSQITADGIDGTGDPLEGGAQPYGIVLFRAEAVDLEDGEIFEPSAFTWRLMDGECGTYFELTNNLCQEEINDNYFYMYLTTNGNCNSKSYTYEVSVQDSDGNVSTTQMSFTVVGWCTAGQGN